VGADISLHVASTSVEFESLAPQWGELAAACRTTGPFMEWPWLFHWWRNYGDGSRLQVMTVAKAGRLIGALPMYVRSERVMRFAPVRILRVVGEGGDTTFDYLEPLLHSEFEEEAQSGLQRLLSDVSRAADVIALPEWRKGSPVDKAFQAPVGWRQVRELPARILQLELPASWDSYMSGVSRNRRYMIRSTRRKLDEAGATFFTNSSPEELPRVFERLSELHHLRWAEKGEAHAFSSAPYINLHRAMAEHLLQAGQLRMHGITIGGATVAMLYCFRHRDAVYHFQGGFDPAYAHLRPGFALYGYAIEHAIGEGAVVFDMLAGEHEYKERWASGAVELRSRELARGNIGGRIYSLRFHRLSALKHWLVAAAAAAAAALSIDP